MDVFKNHTSSLTAPARSAVSVVPADDQPFAQTARAVYVGTGGDLAVEMADGDRVVFVGVPSGTMLPVRITQVLATGTSAGDVLALW